MRQEELKKLIRDEENDCILDEYNEFLDEDVGGYLAISGIEFKMVCAEGGWEGGGENVERVFQIGDTFWKVVGGYSSYNGTEWDNNDLPDQVYPKQKTITVYE